MDGNLRVAWTHWALSWLHSLGGALIFLVFLQTLFSKAPVESPGGVLLLLVIVMGVVALHRSAGRAAERNRPWARSLSRTIAAFLLIGFPLGTAIGLYMLYNCRRKRWPLPESGGLATRA